MGPPPDDDDAAAAASLGLDVAVTRGPPVLPLPLTGAAGLMGEARRAGI